MQATSFPYSSVLVALFLTLSLDAQAQPLSFNFSGQDRPGMTQVVLSAQGRAPLYDPALGYGFVDQTLAQPPRPVHTATISRAGTGLAISEAAFMVEKGFESLHYNNFGMVFRVKAAPGSYAIRVRTTSGVADTMVSVSGLQTSRLLARNNWDAAGLLPNRTPMIAEGQEWTFRYANGRDHIDIEIEPRKPNVPVGVEEITITPLALPARPANVLPTVFTLGDSTVKSYIFDEAPMNGWGQVVDRLFDATKVRLVNYAQGGRSFRNADAEGRFNDLLLSGYPGDVVLIQFGHNDESTDEARRFGRGATEAMYESMIRDVYLPAVRARGMIPVLVTPMSRVHGALKPGEAYVNSFKTRRFPALMKQIGAEAGVTVVDLNARSVEYYNENGSAATTAMVMAIEAGETPGKTNDGSFANGHPANKIDGTHFRQSMSKQYARIVVSELARLGGRGDAVAARLAAALRAEVKTAIASGDWSAVYPEIAQDIRAGEGAYYRDQFEKLLQLGVLSKDGAGNVHPNRVMQTADFITALSRAMQFPPPPLAKVADGPLTREAMGAILADAYSTRFSAKPRYMTEFNGKSVVPGMAGYDPNLDTGAQGAMYYPLVSWARLEDTAAIAPVYRDRVKAAYELGLMRSEHGIERGRMVNGRLLEPKAEVTRAKAAKVLYFMWVLCQPGQTENDTLDM